MSRALRHASISQGALSTPVSTIQSLLSVPTQRLGRRKRQRNSPLKETLRAEQCSNSLQADVAIRNDLTVVRLWLYRDSGEWLEVASAVERTEPGSATLSIDLERVVALVCDENETNQSDFAAQEAVEDLPQARLTAYIEVEGPTSSIPEAAQRLAISPTVLGTEEASGNLTLQTQSESVIGRGLIPLGRFANTDLSEFTSVHLGPHRLTPYVTKKGNIALAVNHELPPYMRVHVDELSVGSTEKVRVAGRIYTRHSRITDLQLQLTARATGNSYFTAARFQFNREETALKYGLNRYSYEAEIPLSRFLESETAEDDIFDAWLTAEVPGSAERHRARVGKNRYLVRRQAQPGTASVGDCGVSVVPYFTMKVKNVSFQVEYFDRRSLSLIDAAIDAPRKFRRLARQAYSQRPVWLIGEMPFKAQDTGLALFKYLIDHHPEIDARYVVDLKSPELVNLVGYEDHVVRHRSEEHVLLSLAASRIIGSHHPDYIYPTRRREFVEACRGLEVFLQHGVMGMKWMTKTYGKSAPGFSTDLFVTSSEREKKMIVDDFGYSPAEVEVTGLSRFDTLFEPDTELKPNQLLILPTWRDWLTTTDSFPDTRFFTEWHSLLNSPELAALCEQFNLEVVFGLHPNMRQHIGAFANTPAKIFIQGEANVQTLIKQSGIMITDYSSAGLDFSFLHKPLLYFQFDSSRFFGKAGSHFDLDRELPGPVSTSRVSLLRQLENLLTTGSSAFEEYFERADRLYPFRDQNNRERIVRAIVNARPHKSIDELLYAEPVQLAKNRFRKSKHYFPTMKRFFAAAKRLPIADDTIVFESGLGRQFSDSPRAVYEELVRREDPRTKVWVYNRSLPVADDNTIVVKRLSPQYFWYLARAKYWVNNQNFPFYITRRKNGVYLQTWHGTPLKKMQHDLESIEGRDAGYLGRVTQASQQWSYLLSPSPYATEAFSTAFRHTAEVVEEGYPRNDILSSPDRQQVADSVRQKLDLPEGKKVLLYAPTFRDDQNISGNRFGFELPFDIEEFAARLGSDYVLLLRMHVVVRNKLTIPEHLIDIVRDVSTHDDINELYLVSDALITDYSSVFFDYSILQKPILFYAYDLENYRDNLRGFYLDYGTELPGPIVTSENELWEEVSSLSRKSSELSARSAAFAAEYAPTDDGHAAERVVDRVFPADSAQD